MLEFRVSALLVFAAYLFSINAAVLDRYNISVPHAFGYHNYSKNPRRVADASLVILIVGVALFGLQRFLLPSLETRLIALSTLFAIIALICSQQRLFRVLRRVILGRISSENRLGDIIVSDALVSMASVLADIGYAISLTFYGVPSSDPLDRPKHIGYKILLLACIPQGIRIKQCIIDYRRTGEKQHLLNLLKYVVGNAPHALRANIALLNGDVPEEAAYMETMKGYLANSLVVNATYSLAWDIIVDWRLGRLREPSSTMRFPRMAYYAAASADTLLRFAFLVSLPIERVIFTLQTLELLRRGIWIAFRMESEPTDIVDEIEMSVSHQK